MITTEGRTYIKRYLAGQVPSIARSIAFGIGSAVEDVANSKLTFEAGRSDINLVSYDFVNNKLVFKAPIDESFGGYIYEVALYSMATSNSSASPMVVTTFDSGLEFWSDPSTAAAAAFTTSAVRLGSDALIQTPAASGTKTDALTNIFLDFSSYAAADVFVVAINVGNANASSVKVRFLTDASNYYEINLGTPTVGYKVIEVAKSAAVVTGTPSWANITEVRVTTNATAGGAASVAFDGIRIDRADTYDQDYVLVSREVLATPYLKLNGVSQDIEFTVDVSIP